MIKNERQYRITKTQAERFERALARLSEPEATGERTDPLLRQVQRDALQSQLEEFREQLEEYEALRSGRRTLPDLASYLDLPRVLIRRRIAAGLSQKDLADRLGLKQQQVQHYEATDYAGASFARLAEVMRALDVRPDADGIAVETEVPLSILLSRLKDLGFEGYPYSRSTTWVPSTELAGGSRAAT